jgi:hypothetical protein
MTEEGLIRLHGSSRASLSSSPSSTGGPVLALSSKQKAFADAVAGVLASLLALYATYPLDVYKTRLQASSTPASSSHSQRDSQKSEIDEKSSTTTTTRNNNTPLILSLLCCSAGWKAKTLHTCASSFCYFFLYGWILRAYKKTREKKRKERGASVHVVLSPSAHLFLSAAAAVLNTFLTLPLDVIASRQQAAASTAAAHSEVVEAAASSLSSVGSVVTEDGFQAKDAFSCPVRKQEGIQGPQRPGGGGDDCAPPVPSVKAYDADGRGGGGSSREGSIGTARGSPGCYQGRSRVAAPCRMAGSSDCSETPSPRRDRRRRRQEPVSSLRLNQLTGLWNGLAPSLLLCSNPAIHYTIYDALKDRILTRPNRRSKIRGSVTSGIDDGSGALTSPAPASRPELTLFQAFVLGVVAKLVATLATYPLIRAKVLLMVNPTSPSPSTQQEDGAAESSSASSSSLWRCLRDDYRLNGVVRGWYAGCGVQLGHTVLKSALTMMAKEKMTRTVRTLLRRALAALRTKYDNAKT